MKQFISNNKKIITAFAICLLIAGVSLSFQTIQYGPLQQFDSITDVPDTIPSDEHQEKLNIKQFNDLMETLNVDVKKAMEEVSKIDMSKINKELKESLKEIDAEKIKQQIDVALKQVDMAAIQNEMSKAMKEVEWSKISTDVKLALDKATNEIKHINMKEIDEQLSRAKIEIEKAKTELKKIDLSKAIKEAETGIKLAQKQLKAQKEMFAEMEKDGLINSKEGFSIEYKDKMLYINGKQQPDAVTEKYRQYIPGDHYKITIDKE